MNISKDTLVTSAMKGLTDFATRPSTEQGFQLDKLEYEAADEWFQKTGRNYYRLNQVEQRRILEAFNEP